MSNLLISPTASLVGTIGYQLTVMIRLRLSRVPTLSLQRRRVVKVKWTSQFEALPHLVFGSEGLRLDSNPECINGEKIYIEVKSTPTDNVSGFYISHNEWTECQNHRDQYLIYRVTQALSKAPKITVIVGLANEIDQGKLTLRPLSYQISSPGKKKKGFAEMDCPDSVPTAE